MGKTTILEFHLFLCLKKPANIPSTANNPKLGAGFPWIPEDSLHVPGNDTYPLTRCTPVSCWAGDPNGRGCSNALSHKVFSMAV